MKAETRLAQSDKDDDAEEEAKTKVGTSADQKKPLADEEEVKMILESRSERQEGR